jgi:hypothetical protein
MLSPLQVVQHVALCHIGLNPVDSHSTMLAKSGVFISKINNTEAVHCIGLLSVCLNCYFMLSTMPAE